MTGTPPETVGCPECGAQAPFEARACPECGFPFLAPATPPSRRVLSALGGAALLLATFVGCAAVSEDALIFWALAALGVLAALSLLWIVRRVRKKRRRTLRWYAVLTVGALGSLCAVGIAAVTSTYSDEMFGGPYMTVLMVVVAGPTILSVAVAFGLVFGTAAALILYGLRGPARRPDPAGSPGLTARPASGPP